MKSVLATLFGVKYRCPQCGVERRVNPLLAAIRGITCTDCALKTNQFYHQKTDKEEVIFLAATPQGGLFILIPLLFISFLTAANFGAKVFFVIIPASYVALSLLMDLCLRRPKIRLGDGRLVIEPGAFSSASLTLDCSPENEPHTTIVRAGKQASLTIHAGAFSESISNGLHPDEWDRLRVILDRHFDQIMATSPEVPVQVTEAENELDHRHPVVLRDDAPEPETGKLDRSGSNSFAAPSKVLVDREGKGLIVRTAIDWVASRNKNCIALALFVFALTATPMLIPFLDSEFTWHAFIMPGLFAIPILIMFHTWIFGFSTEIRRTEITISYYLLGVPIWWRRIRIKDVRQVTPSWFNGIALTTTKGTLRILHCPNRKVRNNTILLLQRKLKDLGWNPEVSFTVTHEDDGVLMIELRPIGVDACLERFNTPGIIIVFITAVISLVAAAMVSYMVPSGIFTTLTFGTIVSAGLLISRLMVGRTRGTSCLVTIAERHLTIEWIRNGVPIATKEFCPSPDPLMVEIAQNPASHQNAIRIARGTYAVQIGSRLSAEDLRSVEKLIRNKLFGAEISPSSCPEAAAHPVAQGGA